MLKEELMFLDYDFANRDEVLTFLTEKAQEAGMVNDKKLYYQAVMDRENEISTAIGYELAIPHGKSETINEAFIMFMRLKNEIRWSKENENTVKMIFMLGIPSEGSENTHLRILSQISRNLMHNDFREQLMTCEDRNAVNELLEKLNL